MPDRPKAIAYDLDRASLVSLAQAFPAWQVEAIYGATIRSLSRDWSPVPANLLVVGARDDVAATLGLCRGLRSQAGRARTPLLVLVAPAQTALVRAALDAGADRCLVLPIHTKNLANVVARAQAEERPGRHTLDLDRALHEDPWRDHGGEA